jgi:hypothetical protein
LKKEEEKAKSQLMSRKMGWPQRRTSRLSMEDPYWIGLDWIGLDSPERRQRQRVPVDYKLMLSQAQTGGFFFFFFFVHVTKRLFLLFISFP